MLPSGSGSSSPVSSSHLLLDLADDLLGLLLVPVDEEPARALGHVAADDQDPDAERRADPEGEAPAEVGGEQAGVEEDGRGEGAAGGADPVAAVDDQVDPAADAGRDQLVDRRVDRRVLAADRGAGEEARRVEVPGGKGEGGRDRGDDVEGEGEEEELLAAEAIGQLAEEERAQTGAADVEGCRGADLAGVEGDAAARFGQPVADAADDRHLEAVEDPDGARARSPPSSGIATREACRGAREPGSRSSHRGRVAHRFSSSGITVTPPSFPESRWSIIPSSRVGDQGAARGSLVEWRLERADAWLLV